MHVSGSPVIESTTPFWPREALIEPPMSWETLAAPSDTEIAALRRENARKARFLADESLGERAAEVLKEQGWNAKFVGDVGLKGRSDEDVLGFAFRDNRMLLTHDDDFLEDRPFPESRNPGIVILPGGSGNETALLRGLVRLLMLIAPYRETYRGAKIVIGATRQISIRSRHHKTGAIRTTRYRITDNGDVQQWVD